MDGDNGGEDWRRGGGLRMEEGWRVKDGGEVGGLRMERGWRVKDGEGLEG